MRNPILIFLLCPLIGFCQLPPDWAIPAEKEHFHVFLLMGQSNMSGYGKLEPGDEVPVPGVLKIPTKGELTWVPAAHPLHNRLGSDRFGLGLPFAKAYMQRHPGVTVGLIPLAWGGAPITKLHKGTPVYADGLKKAMLAKESGVLKGVLWHQGESDTTSEAAANTYEATLHGLIADLRADLGQPALPFVVGNLAEFYGTGKDHRAPDRVARINMIRGILRDLPNKVPHTAFAESTGGSSPDQHMVHFDRKSYIVLGNNYAAAYESAAGFTDLLAGNTLGAWRDQKGYTLKDGIISGRSGHLFTKSEYSDFHLVFEFRLQDGSNNGLAIRSPLKGRPIELQIIDNRAKKYEAIKDYQRHGSLYNYVPAKTGFQKPVGEWNQQEVICRGSMVTVILNGTAIMEADLSTVKPIGDRYIVGYINSASKGHIGFLGHGSPIEIRSISIKELD